MKILQPTLIWPIITTKKKKKKLLPLHRVCMQCNVPLQLGIDVGHVHHENEGSKGPSQMDN